MGGKNWIEGPGPPVISRIVEYCCVGILLYAKNVKRNWNWKMVSAVFVRVAAPRTKSSLWSKSSRNLGSMAKISLHALSILKKHMTEFLGINFGRFCRSMALMVNCYALLSHSTADRRFGSGKGQAIKAVPCGRWTLARVRFVTSPFHCLHELDWQMQPSWWVCHNWKLQN